MNKLLPENINNAIKDWYGDCDYDVVYYWENDETYMVVILTQEEVHCIRLWHSPFAHKVMLSLDHEENLGII